MWLFLGFHIALKAIKLVFDDLDSRKLAPFSPVQVWQNIKEHFHIKDQTDMLEHIYKNFNKSFIASFCEKLSVLAISKDDQLAKYIFREAGKDIAIGIQALLPKVHPDLVQDGYLNVICVGSVWLSWSVMVKGFVSVFKNPDMKPLSFGLKLLRLTKSAAYGACYRGADVCQTYLPRNYEDNYEILFHIEA